MCEGLWAKLQLFEGLCIHAKKRAKKIFSSEIKKMLMIFKLKKKVGDLFILGLVVQKRSPQMIY